VLVVGSGASGCQIVDDLLETGRTVYLSLGSHDRVPRRYRGKDVIWWLFELGEYDRTIGSLRSRPVKSGPGILITGARGGRTIDLRAYEHMGVTLLGHLQTVDDGVAQFAPDAEETIVKGDVMFDRLTQAANWYVKTNGLDLPEELPAVSALAPVTPVERLDLRATRVTSVVWACGFCRDYEWVHIPVFDEHDRPVHDRGVTDVPGLYFIGLPWLHKLSSAFVLGAGADAEFLATRVNERVASRSN
jgi:putative flavoprotein involved in K+ transport